MKLKYKKEQYPKISVITTCYNRENTIRKAITCTLEQNYPNLELLILDGGSKDKSVDIINEYIEHISYFRSHKDNGNAEALNEGIQNCSGELISFVNSDDFLSPNTLIQVGEKYIENPDADIITTNYNVIIQKDNGEYETIIHPKIEDMLLNQDRLALLAHCNRYFKKAVFEETGYHVEEIGGIKLLSNDYELMTRLSLLGVKDVGLDIVGCNYLSHEDSLTISSGKFNVRKNYEYWAKDVLACNKHVYERFPNMREHGISKDILRSYAKSNARKIFLDIIDLKLSDALSSFKEGREIYGLKRSLKSLLTTSVTYLMKKVKN